MNNFNIKDYRNYLLWGILIFGLFLIIMGYYFTPSFISQYVSSERILLDETIYKIWIFRILFVLLGILLTIFGFLALNQNKFVSKAEEYFVNKIIPIIKRPKTMVKTIFVLLAIISLFRIIDLTMNEDWQKISGGEHFWIAKSIANGHGYSFKAQNRWLFHDFDSEYQSDEYFTTAWEEPVYPYFAAFSLKYFGNYSGLVILIGHIIALYFTALFVYLLIQNIFNSSLGVFSSVWLLLWWPEARLLSEHSFSIAIFGGLGLSISAYLFLWFLDKISIKRGMILGFVLGITCLTISAAILIVPLVILITLFYNRKSHPVAWRESIAILTIFILVLFPWVARNWLVFGELVLTRNGAGQGIHLSNQTIASTFCDGEFAYEDSLGPIWRAEDAGEAIKLASKEKEKLIEIFKRAHNTIALEAPENYDEFNEAQRDKFYLKTSIGWIFANPKIFLELTYYRLKVFLGGWKTRHTLVTIFALISVLFSWKNPKVLILVVVIAGYIFVFSLVVAFYYRYRYPIEPLFLVLLSGFPIFIFNKIKTKILNN